MEIAFEVALHFLDQGVLEKASVDFIAGNTGVVLALVAEEGDGQRGGTKVEAHWNNGRVYDTAWGIE